MLLLILEKKPTNNSGTNTNAEQSRMKLVEEEFGGPKEMKFSEIVPRNTYNKIASLKNMNISNIDMVHGNWVIMTMDLSKNKLSKFPVELAKLDMLKVLKLDENLIPEVRYEELIQFKSLDQLDIRSNNMKKFCQDFDELTADAKCQIYHSHLKVILFGLS
jgi:Leucine-rich repeat (LRR) protein